MKKTKGPKITKEILIERFFALKGMETTKMDQLIIRINSLISRQPDTDLTLILCLLNAYKAEHSFQPFENCCTIAAPIFEILDNTTNWGYLELFVLSSAISYHQDFNKTYELFQETLDVLDLDEHANNPKCRSIRTALHGNFTQRINRARYYESTTSSTLLKKLFEDSYAHAMEVFERINSPLKHVLEVRRGIHENNLAMSEAGLNALKKRRETRQHLYSKDELMEFIVEMDGELSPQFYKYLQGYQIRKRRIELGMSVEDLAEALGWDEPLLTAIERGSDGASIRRLRKIAHELRVSLDYFYGDEEKKYDQELDLFMYAINAHTHDATETDKKFILNMVKSYMDTKKA